MESVESEGFLKANRSQFLRIAVLGFIGGVFLDGLSNILAGAGFLSTPIFPGMMGGGLLGVIGALTILYGFLVIGAGVFLYSFVFEYERASELRPDDLKEDNRLWFSAILFSVALFFLGVSFIVGRAYTPGVTGVIGVALGLLVFFSWSREIMPALESPVLRAILVLVAGIFLAIAGFSSHVVVAGAHIGVFSIGLILATLVPLVATGGNSEKAEGIVAMLVVLVFSVALIVGGAIMIWNGARFIGAGGLFSASAVLGLLGGLSSLLAGIMALLLGVDSLSVAAKKSGEEPPLPPPPPPS